MEYQRIYTDLRTAQMSFAEFMDFLGKIHNLGVEKGATTITTEDTPSFFAAAPLASNLNIAATSNHATCK